jgi:hypothetical protein
MCPQFTRVEISWHGIMPLLERKEEVNGRARGVGIIRPVAVTGEALLGAHE